MKTTVTYQPHPLGHSQAQKLWKQGVPNGRKVALEYEADICLYDEASTASEALARNPSILHIVVADESPEKLPKGIFWIRPDVRSFTQLLRTLMR